MSRFGPIFNQAYMERTLITFDEAQNLVKENKFDTLQRRIRETKDLLAPNKNEVQIMKKLSRLLYKESYSQQSELLENATVNIKRWHEDSEQRKLAIQLYDLLKQCLQPILSGAVNPNYGSFFYQNLSTQMNKIQDEPTASTVSVICTNKTIFIMPIHVKY